jgi:hypothetical protein
VEFRSLIIFLLVLISQEIFPQNIDSLWFSGDSVLQVKMQKVDSIHKSTKLQFKSLKDEYDSVQNFYASQSLFLQRIADSLNNIGLPSEKYTFKIDSINNVKEQKLNSVKIKVQEVKQRGIERIDDLDLPPELNGKLEEYTKALNSLDIGLLKAEIDFPMLDEFNVSISEIKTSLPSVIDNLNVVQLPGDIKLVGNEMQDIQLDIHKIPSAENIAQKAEDNAEAVASKKLKELKTLSVDQPEIPADSEKAKEVVVKEAKKQSIDHFAGKQEQLKAAMDKMSKYKQKFSNVQSIKVLPKKASNEMRDKPIIERVVPGLSFQYQFRNSYMLDTYVYAGYRLTGKITTGIGWNQRLARDKDNSYWNQKASIYGPRAFGNYRLGKGFMAQLEVESMNTFVSYSMTDPAMGQREWVWGSMTGLKKEYRIIKQLKGTILVLYNIFDPRHRSPYNDRLNTRIGLEYRIKKKQKTKEN